MMINRKENANYNNLDTVQWTVDRPEWFDWWNNQDRFYQNVNMLKYYSGSQYPLIMMIIAKYKNE